MPIFDGFHLLAPHFEMLYDNAQIVDLLVRACRTRATRCSPSVQHEDWCLREMIAPTDDT